MGKIENAASLAGPLGLAGGVFLLDRVTKSWRMPLQPQAWPWPGTLELVQHFNRGLIANIEVPRLPVIMFTSALAFGLFLLMARDAKKRSNGSFALALILGGALGNIYDRIAYSFVFDWIMLFRTSIVNVADIAVILGVLLYVVLWQRQESLDARPKTP